MTTRTTVRLAPDLLKAAKKKAVEDGRTLTSLIEEGLHRVVHDVGPTAASQRAKHKPFKLPVSKARGGLRPGFDLTNMATFYDAEDAEVVEQVFGKTS